MNHSDLGNPRPRHRVEQPTDVPFPIAGCRYLDIPNQPHAPNIWEVIECRQSRRNLRPIERASLSDLLWYTAKIRSSRQRPGGVTWQHRPVPSAGGCHPIDILLIERPQHPTLALYDAGAHALCELAVNSQQCMHGLVSEINEITMNEEGAILLFVANFSRTAAMYEEGESLVWRDSGALLAMCYLVAEALGHGCCGIGATGEPWVSTLLGFGPAAQGVGGCVIGARDG